MFNYDSVTSEFLPFGGMELNSVAYIHSDGCLDRIILFFDDESLVIQAERDYDTVQLSRVPNSEIVSLSDLSEPHDIWSKYIGQKFSWGWVMINQQNYLDGIILSFGSIAPNVLLNVAASSIYVFELSEITD